MHHLKKVTNFCLYMRYANYKKTLDKYGRPKETISIWAPSHTPHWEKNRKTFFNFLSSGLGINVSLFRLRQFGEVGAGLGSPKAGVEIGTG